MEADGTMPRWTLRLSKEVEAINQAILEDLRCPFSSILLEENSVAFELTKTEMKIYFQFYITEDYPDHCLLNQRTCLKVNNEQNKSSGGDSMMCENGNTQTLESSYCDMSFTATFTDLAKKHYKQMRIPEVSYKRQPVALVVPEQISLSNPISQSSNNNAENKKRIDSDDDDDDVDDDDDDDDDDDGWDIVYDDDDDDDENEDWKMIRKSTTMNLEAISDIQCTTPLNLDFEKIHLELKEDLRSVEEQLSSDRVKYYTSSDNEVIRIVLTLERSTHQNSGGNGTTKVDNNLIDIRLLCYSSQYYNEEITIKVSQRSGESSFRSNELLQIEQNLETFLSLIGRDLKDFNKQKNRMDRASRNKNGAARKSSSAAYLELLQQFACFDINLYYHPKAETINATTWSNPYNFLCDGRLIESLRPNHTIEFNKGLLLLLYQYASYRLNVNAHVHRPVSDRMLPSLFDKKLFAFFNQSDDSVHDGIEWMKENPEVLELLIAFSKAAVTYYKSNWSDRTITYSASPANGMELAPEQEDFVKLDKVLKSIPRFYKSLKKSKHDLKRRLDNINPLISLLMKWIVESKRSQIVPLPRSRRLECMNTKWQYLLSCCSPEKDKIFLEARSKYGSTFAFHGSPTQNWHSIIRHGLLVPDRRSSYIQLHGAAHGEGIYVSPQSGMSLSYAQISFDYMDRRNMRYHSRVKNTVFERRSSKRSSSHQWNIEDAAKISDKRQRHKAGGQCDSKESRSTGSNCNELAKSNSSEAIFWKILALDVTKPAQLVPDFNFDKSLTIEEESAASNLSQPIADNDASISNPSQPIKPLDSETSEQSQQIADDDTSISNPSQPIKQIDSETSGQSQPIADNDTSVSNPSKQITQLDSETSGQSQPIADNDTSISNPSQPITQLDSETSGQSQPTADNDTSISNSSQPIKQLDSETSVQSQPIADDDIFESISSLLEELGSASYGLSLPIADLSSSEANVLQQVIYDTETFDQPTHTSNIFSCASDANIPLATSYQLPSLSDPISASSANSFEPKQLQPNLENANVEERFSCDDGDDDDDDDEASAEFDHSSLRCIALCEVICSEYLKKPEKNIWVITNPDHVCTRFLFVYDRNTVAKDLSVTDAEFRKQLARALKL